MAEEMKGSVQMGDDILVLENITKVYPNGFVANKDVNLRVKKAKSMLSLERMAPAKPPS